MRRKHFGFKNVLLIVFIILGVMVIPQLLSESANIKELSYNDFISKIYSDNVSEVVEIPSGKLVLKMKDSDSKFVTNKIDNSAAEGDLYKAVKSKNVKLSSIKTSDFSDIIFWILGVLPIALMIFFFFNASKKMNLKMSGSSFGGKDDGIDLKKNKKVTFKDVAGLLEAKQDLSEIVEFLKTPAKFHKLGAKIPRGVLMLGRPGTGKTLLAKAVAGEANVPFFNVSGAEFVEMFVGVGASRVRELFNKAKEHSPCIIFIDEIDAVARQRGVSHGGGNDEREQTLNQLLVEMDGFKDKENVIVMAATNRSDVLDKAILRPGRFDRHVVVDAPSVKDREAILQVHAKNKPLGDSVNLKTIAKKTVGFVGADLANILNESAILAARHNRSKIEKDDLEEAVERVIAGPQRKSKVISEKEREIVAYHEAGHALVAHFLPDSDPVHKISIIPRGAGALGYTLQLPTEDKFLISKSEFINELKVLMGGRAAEEIIFKEITSGASNDIEKATRIAKNMISKYGMSKHFGPRAFGGNDRESYMEKEMGQYAYSNETAREIDKEITKLISDSYKEALNILKNNLDKLQKLTKYLLKHEIVFENEIPGIIG